MKGSGPRWRPAGQEVELGDRPSEGAARQWLGMGNAGHRSGSLYRRVGLSCSRETACVFHGEKLSQRSLGSAVKSSVA